MANAGSASDHAELLVLIKCHDVTAKTRKRCPQCNKMVEVGTEATLKDDRYTQSFVGATPWIGNVQHYARGAWHLYHRPCFDSLFTAEVEAQRAQFPNRSPR